MISLGRMSAGLIHEINNPLNYVMSAMRQLKRKCENSPAGSLDDVFADIDHGLKRVSDLVSSLRTFSHPNPREFESVNLLKCVTQACRLTSPLDAQSMTPEIDVRARSRRSWQCHTLSQVFINLIQNAMDACNAHPDIPSLIRIGAEADGDNVIVKISDNGEGIPADIIDKIFDPFFTTKDVGSGMGLGLSICHAIIKSHGGRLDVESEPSRGTVATLTLPTRSKPENTDSKPVNVEEHHELLI